MMLPFLFSLILVAHARPGIESENPIRLHSDGGLDIARIDCTSWRWAVETNNEQNWAVVPEECVPYVAHYMDAPTVIGENNQYKSDIEILVLKARQHLTTINPAQNGKDLWIFDLDECLLSDLPYYRRPEVNYGGEPFNETAFEEWIGAGELPGINAIVKLYNEVLAKGYKTVILSGTSEKFRDARVKNLHAVGVSGWEMLILWQSSDSGKTALQYKSQKRSELVKEGYKIIGNIGDQWSDLLGPNPAERTFKVPNPMYYVA